MKEALKQIVDAFHLYNSEHMALQAFGLRDLVSDFEIPGVAPLVVSDNTASGAPLVGRSEEQQKRYDCRI